MKRIKLALGMSLLGLMLLYSAPPLWWVERGVTEEGIDESSHETLKQNHSAVMQGQLMNIAKHGADEITTKYQGGMGEELEGLLASFQTYSTENSYSTVSDQALNFNAINVGQLKTIAKPFYDRLWEIENAWPGAVSWPVGIEFQSEGKYPWPETTPENISENYTLANIGQVKFLFSWELNKDSDNDGIPDWWEIHYGLDPNDPTDASLPFNPNRGRIALMGASSFTITYLSAYISHNLNGQILLKGGTLTDPQPEEPEEQLVKLVAGTNCEDYHYYHSTATITCNGQTVNAQILPDEIYGMTRCGARLETYVAKGNVYEVVFEKTDGEYYNCYPLYGSSVHVDGSHYVEITHATTSKIVMRVHVFDPKISSIVFDSDMTYKIKKDADGTQLVPANTPHYSRNGNGKATAYPLVFETGKKPKIKSLEIDTGLPVPSKYFEEQRGRELEGHIKVVDSSMWFEGKMSSHSGQILRFENLETGTALKEVVRYYEKGRQLYFYGGSVSGTETFDSEIYVVKQSSNRDFTYFYETVLHLACKYANGKSSVGDIVGKIWENIQSLVVRRKNDNKQLKYYNPEKGAGEYLDDMLKHKEGSGNCLAWAEFFHALLQVHGIDSEIMEVKPNKELVPGATGLLVKNWIFGDHIRTGRNGMMESRIPQGIDDIYYEYYPTIADQICVIPGQDRILQTPTLGDDTRESGVYKGTNFPYAWGIDISNYPRGVKGHGNENPPTAFELHYIVGYASKIYDPSYGLGPFSEQIDYERAAIDGFHDGERKRMRKSKTLGNENRTELLLEPYNSNKP